MVKPPSRPGFREWVDKQPDPTWGPMPLTHVTKSLLAEDIIRSKRLEPKISPPFEEPMAYFFYGRPAYRTTDEGAIKLEAACPFCFIFDPSLIKKASDIYAFDTGAFASRLYKHALTDEMNLDDFSLRSGHERPNKLISAVFGDASSYVDGNISKVPPVDQVTKSWEFLPRSYLHLVSSRGRNEPDDRLCSIEVVVGKKINVMPFLKAVVVPHMLWDPQDPAPWLLQLTQSGVDVEPYEFIPGKSSDHYHALLCLAVRAVYKRWGHL
jgi:hypothetical protein